VISEDGRRSAGTAELRSTGNHRARRTYGRLALSEHGGPAVDWQSSSTADLRSSAYPVNQDSVLQTRRGLMRAVDVGCGCEGVGAEGVCKTLF